MTFIEEGGAASGPMVAGCILLVVIACFGVVLWAVLRARRKAQVTESLLAGLGYQELPEPPVELARRVEALHRRHPGQKFELRRLFGGSLQAGGLYVFELVDAGDDSSASSGDMTAVISPALALPHAIILGRPALEEGAAAWLVSLSEKFLSWAVSSGGLRRLGLEAYPQLDSRLIVMVEDRLAAGDYFSPERLGRLLWLSGRTQISEIRCSEDCFTLRRAYPSGQQGEEAELRSLLDDTRRAFSALL